MGVVSRFSATDRAEIRAELRRGVDVLIVGGGINGAGLARDLALRGARVGLVEKDDFASGTSSKSSRLIHGGLRYLEHGQLGLVFESVTERWRLSSLARHLVRPLRFVLPAYQGGRVPWWKLRAGVAIYDALALFRNYENHRPVPHEELAALLPTLDRTKVTRTVSYFDYRTNDARITLENVIAAREAGAFPLSKAAAMAPLFDGKRLAGATVRDELGGERFDVPAKIVVSCTGPWTDEALRMLGRAGTDRRMIRPTKGVHIVVPAEKLPLRSAAALTHPRDGRVLFALPFGSRTVLGTTDTYWSGPVDDVKVEASDVDYLIEVASVLFPSSKLSREDVLASWAGLRPLLAVDETTESSVPREQKTMTTPDGLIAIFGGKLTTYRQMAEELGDVVAEALHARGGPVLQASRTRGEPLPGAIGLDRDDDLERVADHVRARGGITRESAMRLVESYGVRATDVLDRAALDPTGRLLDRIDPALPHLWIEVVWAAEQEMALDLEDVMVRRVGLFYDAADQGASIAEEAARWMGKSLDWDAATQTLEVERFLAVIAKGRAWRDTPAAGPVPAPALSISH